MSLPSYPSMAACAAATGIPLPVLRQAKRAGCPAFDQANRVHLRLLLPWLFSQDADAGTDWHQRYKRAMALGAEQNLAKARGDLIDAHVLGSHLMAAGSACKTLIAQQVQEAPLRLAGAGGDIVEIRTILRGILDEFFNRFRETVSPYMVAVEKHTAEAEQSILNPQPTDEKNNPQHTLETESPDGDEDAGD